MNGHPNIDGCNHNLPVVSVGELSKSLKRVVETTFDVVRVRGEISGFKRAASGHLYFALKDETAVLDAVCWRAAAARLAAAPDDGLEVIITGRLTTYPSRSKYQISVEAIELAGEGALLKLLEERRRRLAEEGLFDAARKRDTPFLPEVIGVVTSPTGAVIRDILHRLADRFPRRVLLWPVLVQGSGAAEQVAAAIAGFNALSPGGDVPRPDVIIVARGGGSLEDLWAFNEEVVVRAAAASAIPLVSAVGHETDVTLIDHAADRRAPTPTAAAEMAVPVRMELVAQVEEQRSRLIGAINRWFNDRRLRIEAAARGLPRPAFLVGDARQRLDDWSERLAQSLFVGLERRRQRMAHLAASLISPVHRVEQARVRLTAEHRALTGVMTAVMTRESNRLRQAAALLESYSYQRILERGFVLVHDTDNAPVTSVSALSVGMPLGLRFHDGEAKVRVDGRRGERPKPDKGDRRQRRLL